MAEDKIQRPPETFPPSQARLEQATTASPPPAPPSAPSPTTPPPSPHRLYYLKFAGIVAAVAIAGTLALFAITGGVHLGLVGWLIIFVVVGAVAARFFLGAPPVPAMVASTATTQSDVSNTREVIETVVFVVVLVLLLKSFVAEAFVIPTGSMATTLYGYQKLVTCPKCGYEFPVNCSQEVDPQEGDRVVITGCTCPNCRFPIPLAKEEQVVERVGPNNQQFVQNRWVPTEGYKTGDRVLVGKFLYDLPWTDPEKHRLNVVVFKYPEKPMKDYTPMNYIKRLIGLPNETIAIYYGKIYVLSPDKGLRFDDSDVPELDRWQYKYMHVNDDRALALWDKKEFRILRRPPDVVMAERRIVYDYDHPAKDLKDSPRWQKGGAWSEDDSAHSFKHAAGGDLDWLHYRHIIARPPGSRTKPELITDFMGYNSYEPQPSPQAQHWVGDLMLECDVTIDKPEGNLVLELSRASDRFRAVFDLATGECSLRQLKKNKVEAPALDAGEELAKKPTALKKSGTYHVRFANVDDRLLLWVDRDLPFGEEGAGYTAGEDRGPTEKNDLWPASIGAKGAGATVSKLQLWRDTYYTQMQRGGGDDFPMPDRNPESWLADPDSWGPLHNLKPMTLYVQPGHYLCLGDNSPHSSDGRVWGLVPDRLMLGRALMVYYPFPPLGNRAGPIH
jgi:signal peptidase I